MKIAILDDVKGVRDSIKTYLLHHTFKKSEDIRVDTICSYFDIESSQLLDYDLLIIDEAMEKVNGSEIVSHLWHMVDRDYDKLPCIVFVTGFYRGVLDERLRKTGFDRNKLRYDVLQKPFKFIDLKKVIYEICPEYVAFYADDEPLTVKECVKSFIENVLFGILPIPTNLGGVAP